MKYPGLGYLGSERISALYGLNETIHDQKAIGLQHLFIDDYQVDLIHTGLSVITVDDVAYYADRVKPKSGHPLRHASSWTKTMNNCILKDKFNYPEFSKVDSVGSYDSLIYFESKFENKTSETKHIKCSSLVITQPYLKTSVTEYKKALIVNSENKWYSIISHDSDQIQLSLDAPSGFMYHGIEDILFETNSYNQPIVSHHPIAMSISKRVEILPYDNYTFKWSILVGKDEEDVKKKIDEYQNVDHFKRIKSYWAKWLRRSSSRESSTMLVALKSALMEGFLPADLTGHYFAKGKVCFYVRDALMASRAFMYSNHPNECKSIVNELLKCPRKPNGEFYQRYNAYHLPDEGANNNVFSQIDVIGYFGRVVSDYHALYGEWLVPYPEFSSIMNSLKNINTKENLFGPEGGVNEGVYGPAFITSTNMFIVGGLRGAIDYAKALNKLDDYTLWNDWIQHVTAGIENMMLNEGYYSYGYVDYQPTQIRRYDTPQLLSYSLGYPISKNTQRNFNTLLECATYFGLGFGYSEQEYHNGPWLFNTAGAAETAYLLKDIKTYHGIMEWMRNHRNGYGLLPEAIDATNEKHAFINPLMWANAEFVCAENIEIIEKLRNGK